jgi:hypothetical protein
LPKSVSIYICIKCGLPFTEWRNASDHEDQCNGLYAVEIHKLQSNGFEDLMNPSCNDCPHYSTYCKGEGIMVEYCTKLNCFTLLSSPECLKQSLVAASETDTVGEDD